MMQVLTSLSLTYQRKYILTRAQICTKNKTLNSAPSCRYIYYWNLCLQQTRDRRHGWKESKKKWSIVILHIVYFWSAIYLYYIQSFNSKRFRWALIRRNYLSLSVTVVCCLRYGWFVQILKLLFHATRLSVLYIMSYCCFLLQTVYSMSWAFRCF